MWFDCGNVLINLDHVDYVQFEQGELGKATVYFNSGDSLFFEHNDIDVLKNHFRKITEIENGHRTSNGKHAGEGREATEVG